MKPEAVIFVGLQASGKSSFYLQHFYKSHVRINLDMLRTRYRERLILQACLEAKQSFVIDNTNPSSEDRARYLQPALDAGFDVVGYYFSSKLADCLKRNANRQGKERIPDAGVRGTAARLELPKLAEGFSRLYFVSHAEKGEFEVKDWVDEVY